MIRIKGLKVKVKENIDLYEVVSNKLRIPKNKIEKLVIHKKSLDARSISKFNYIYDIDIQVPNEDKYLNNYITKIGDEEYDLPIQGTKELKTRPVIIGSGPAGLFCAYHLAKYGYQPIIIEQGEMVEDRIKTVEALWQKNIFQENSNVQFGEGGAGTFSDGKLNTLTHDKEYRMKEIFQIFVDSGAPEDIMYEHMPHIGTDILRKVIINLREKIKSFGGEFRYNSKLEDLIIADNKITGIIVNGNIIKTDCLVLAIGHSARDTFKMLYNHGLNMEAKPFAVGLRIIHPQELINASQYPINYSFLPAANYKLTYKAKNGRGVYSFCMCPGGYVVNARSTAEGIVVNGMSNSKRDSNYANSAIVTTINPSDFDPDVFSGMYFQEQIEKKAFNLASGYLPVQKYQDYKIGKISNDIACSGIKGLTKSIDINEIFPEFINDTLKEGIDYFATKINGFSGKEAILVAPETRTSSPLRIIRNELLESNIQGIYPCGEGSGYAGGITTSAIDGLKVFESIYQKYTFIP